jgi:hypothetical protein
MSVRINGTTGVTTPNLTATTKVTTADLANTGNYNGGQLGNRNLVINGAMQVAQRGTSSTSTNYQTVDRWRNGFGNVTLTQSQEDLTSGEPFDQGFRSFLRLTQSGSASAATDFAQISQRIEGLNAATSGWNYKSSGGHVAYSFWVRSSLAGTYYIYMQTRSSSGDGYINVPFTVAANTWTKVTASIAGNSSLNIDNDNTTGIEFRIVPYYGTNYTSSTLPSNTWYYSTSSGELPDYAQNWCGTSGATFDVTGVQLEVGDTATPFEHRSYGDELAKCQRYYEKIFLDDQYRLNGVAWSTESQNISLPFTVTKRGPPSISISSIGQVFTGSWVTPTGSEVTGATINGGTINIRKTGSYTVKYGYFIRGQDFRVDAEL